MRYPSEKQMLASIFEAIMNKEPLDFSRGDEKRLFVNDDTNNRFEAFFEGFEFHGEMFGKETRLDIH
jgi:hypothetical protein